MDNIDKDIFMKTVLRISCSAHRLLPGRSVYLYRDAGLPNAAKGIYEILVKLPEQNGEPRYCIRSDREPYTRSVREGDIKLTRPADVRTLSARDLEQATRRR
jgi:hypothetical protein